VTPRPRTLDERAFPRQLSRTRRFALGVPRSFTIASDGSRVAFLRSRAGDDPVTCLWVLDVEAGRERLIADPRRLAVAADVGSSMSSAERARRERARESASGIVAYACDRMLRTAAFALEGASFVVDLRNGTTRRRPGSEPVDDPRVDPTGRRIAHVSDGRLYVGEIGGAPREIAGEDDPAVQWGLPEFIAAEEMGRLRGFWWSPDGERVLAARVDERTVGTWYVSDPAEPGAAPRALRYPAAGKANAVVSLAAFDAAGGGRVETRWDADAYPYLARVAWSAGRPVLLVQSRDQRVAVVLEVDVETGETTERSRQEDESWVELVDGSPLRLDGGAVVTAEEGPGARMVAIDGRPATDGSLDVRAIAGAAGGGVVFIATPRDDPSSAGVWHVAADGRRPSAIEDGPGVHDAVAAGSLVVVSSRTLDGADLRATVRRLDAAPTIVATIGSVAEMPVVRPQPRLFAVGARSLRCALLLPSGESPDRPLPVLCDPYGGPHHQRVVRAAGAYVTSQWFADRGFAVLVADGRGTPGRGREWERSIRGDFSIALDDQIDALADAAAAYPGVLDTTRVGIRGWSFGGYLAAVAVMRRPDVFHAAVAGAPVTDWRLYDTHYTERYLGMPEDDPAAYRRSAVPTDASGPRRPLLLVHGLADDNVVVAHTLRFSAALFEAGRPHEVVLLPDVTHMSSARSTEERLLALELDFLRRSLEITVDPDEAQ
jgi:dipeptidyl-peptidase 4